MLKIELPKKVFLYGSEWTIQEESQEVGGRWSWQNMTIFIGTASKKNDPGLILATFLHELAEVLASLRGHRYKNDCGANENQIFVLDHNNWSNLWVDMALAMKDVKIWQG